jgi:hypothetical protein
LSVDFCCSGICGDAADFALAFIVLTELLQSACCCLLNDFMREGEPGASWSAILLTLLPCLSVSKDYAIQLNFTRIRRKYKF